MFAGLLNNFSGILGELIYDEMRLATFYRDIFRETFPASFHR